MAVAVVPSEAVAQDAWPSAWSQWRGPARDGVLTGPAWPGDLDTVQGMWRVEMGKGYASPILAADRVFIHGSREDGTVVVQALDRASGRQLWSREWQAGTDVPFFAASHGSWVRSTPAWDGQTLYLGDMRETLVAIDGATGQDRWRLTVPAALGTGVPSFGFASSPMLAGGFLYVQAGSSLLKIDPATGGVVWRALDGSTSIMSDGAFSSPVMATIAGVEQVVVFTRRMLAGVDAASGKTLWSTEVPNFRGMNIVTPLVAGDSIFVSQYQNGSYRYDVSGQGDSLSVSLAWNQKASGYMSSPVLLDGHAYQHLGNGRLTCIDLESGQETWRTTPLGEYWSMLLQGERILALDSEGTLRLIAANPDSYHLVAEREVASTSTWGHLAVDSGQIFIREIEALSVYSWRHGETVPASDPAAAGGVAEAAPATPQAR
jgi:outer membrane protein assembly factor BamB